MKQNLKRTRWSLPAMALVLTLGIAALAFTAQADQDREDGGKGEPYAGHHGAGGGMGLGMAPGMGFMPGLMAKLPQDKREQVRKIHTGMQRQMIAQRSQIQTLRLDMRELMRAYPLDQGAVLAKMEAMQQVRREMFSLRLATMAKVQQVAGKVLWDETQATMGAGMGPGFGHGQRGQGSMKHHGPGMERGHGSQGDQGEKPKQ